MAREGCGRKGAAHSRQAKQKPEAELAARDAERIQQLERLVGELTLENRFFRGALQRIKDVRQQSGARGVMPSSPKSKR